MKSPTALAKVILMASTSLAMSASFSANAQEAETLADAIVNGDAYIDARYRLESVSQDNLTALTLR